MKFNLGYVWGLLAGIGLCCAMTGFIMDDTILYAVGVLIFDVFVSITLLYLLLEYYLNCDLDVQEKNNE